MADLITSLDEFEAEYKKTVGETLISFPVLLAYYQVRLAGYMVETVRLRLGLCRIERTRLRSRP